MQNIKLFLILKSLSQAEIKELGKFVSSPYHNTNKTLLKFFNILKKQHPNFTSRTLEMENIYKKLFPSNAYNSGVMRNLVSELIRITEGYLAFQNFKKDKYDFYFHLLNQLKTRNVEKLFEKTLNEAFAQLKNSVIRDENYYYNKYLLESVQREFYQNKLPVGKWKTVNEKLPSEIESLKYSFFISLLKEFFSIYNIQHQLKLNYRYKFLDEIMNHISEEEAEYKNVPMIFILKTFLSLLIEGKNEHLVPQLKNMIDKNREIMSLEDYKYFYLELLNYYKNKQFSGDKSAGRKSFELNKEMLEKDIYLQPGELMSAHGYVNTCATAIRIRELNWAEEFTNKYSNRLLPNHQLNAYLYNYAAIHYIRGNDASDQKEKEEQYRKSMDYLSKVKSEDFFYMTRIKNLLIMTHYQLGEMDMALNIIVNYKQYLLKNKSIPENLVERYRNFIDFTYKLIKAGQKSDYGALMQLKKELNTTPKTEYKGWLMKKINDLKIESPSG